MLPFSARRLQWEEEDSWFPDPVLFPQNTVGELRSTLCTKTPLYSYIKQMPLEHLSYIKETSWNTSDRT